MAQQDPTGKFLSASDREKIQSAVERAEQRTSGEIIPLVVAASYHYPMAGVLGATTLALPPAILLTPFIGGLFWIGAHNMWVFIGLFTLLFAGSHLVIQHLPWLKRLFISQAEIETEVREAAVTSFFREGLYRTRDATGVLLFVSVFEHKVWVLADHGISAKVPPGAWEEVVAGVVAGLKQGHPAEAICQAVERIGAMLEVSFPVKPDDTNELQNLIVRDMQS